MTVLDLQVLPMRDSAREQELRTGKGAPPIPGSGASSIAGHARGEVICPQIACVP
jgi:hypothetical protein